MFTHARTIWMRLYARPLRVMIRVVPHHDVRCFEQVTSRAVVPKIRVFYQDLRLQRRGGEQRKHRNVRQCGLKRPLPQKHRCQRSCPFTRPRRSVLEAIHLPDDRTRAVAAVRRSTDRNDSRVRCEIVCDAADVEELSVNVEAIVALA